MYNAVNLKALNKFREIEPLIYALQSIFGFLQLLDILQLQHYPTIHRATIPLKFNLPFPATPIRIIGARTIKPDSSIDENGLIRTSVSDRR